MIIKLLVDGGDMKPGPAIGQKLGPIGINIGNVISQVNQATKEFKGTKVPVALDIDAKTKAFKIEVSSPPTSELLKKEMAIEKGSGEHKKTTVGNASIEQIIKIAKIKHQDMLAKEFKSAVKSVIGSCVSLGILVESKPAVEIEKEIEEGVFDREINEQKTEASAQKKAELNAFFEKVFKEQNAAKAAEEAAKAAKEAEKAVAAGAAVAGAAAPAGSADAAKAKAAAEESAKQAKPKEEPPKAKEKTK